MAFGALGDVDTGAPVLLSEMTLTTAIRTAATSALAARYLARKDSKRMALIGNGSQRVPGHGLPHPAGHRRNPPVRHRPPGLGKARRQPGRLPAIK
jgi:hypothetical protein